MLIRNAEIHGVPGLDCRIQTGRITELARGLKPGADEEVLEACGGALIAGLADHHIHLAALAAWRQSVDLTGVDRTGLPAHLHAAVPDVDGWVRAVGYHEEVHGDLDRHALDTCPAALRVQHRSGALWVLNSAALIRTAAETASFPGIERDQHGHPTGRLWRADEWLRDRLPGRISLRSVGKELASHGITHLADATPDPDGGTARLLATAIANGELPQHVATMSAGPSPDDRLISGPVKLVVPDHTAPDLDALIDDIHAAHAQARPVAVHCVTRQALALTIAALEAAGHHAGDRIEHCAVAGEDAARILAEHRVTVVTQPTLLALRGDDYRHGADRGDLPDLWRHASLRAAGVPVAVSSDAPYGDPDPWACLRAARDRRTPAGLVLGPGEQVPPGVTLATMQCRLTDPAGQPRTVQQGASADLVLLDRPLAKALTTPETGQVVATIIDGQLTYHREL